MRLAGNLPVQRRDHVTAHHFIGFTQMPDHAVFQPHAPLTQGFHISRFVGDKQNRRATRPQIVNTAHTALAKSDIAHRQCLIYDQDFGVDMRRHCKRQTQHHAR